MKLGVQVGLGPGHIMLDGDPPPLPKKGTEPPVFGTCPLSPNGWMDQDETWHVVRPRPWPHCVGTQPLQKGGHYHPQLSAHVYCGETIAHLSYC